MAVEISKSSDRERDSIPARCRPSITCGPQASPVSGGAKVDRVGGRSLSAIIWQLNPASLPRRWHLSRAVVGQLLFSYGAVRVDESPLLGGVTNARL